MTDLVVDGSTRLDRFLRTRGVQAWRIPILLASGGIQAFRGRTVISPLAADTRLQGNDVVRLRDPPPASALAALQREADSNARDLAFVPGATAFDTMMQRLMQTRTATVLFADPLVDSLRGFVAALGRSERVLNPIRHLLLGSHANAEGLLFMKLDVLAAAHITYEDLEAAVRGRSLVIDPHLLEPRPHDASGAPLSAKVLIRGCRIGRAPAYLRKLKEALGNQLPVIAPKHFHVVSRQTQPAGFSEYMNYGFGLVRPAAFRNRADAVSAFSAGGFTRIDGSAVPARSWAEWIPSAIRRTSEVHARLVSPITGARERFTGQFRVHPRTLLDREGSVAVAADPGTAAARKQAVRDDLVAREPRYQSTHAFPEYVRYGHATMDEFMDSWTWQFRYDAARHLLYYNATRVEYTVVQPISDPANNRVFLNYYPIGSGVPVIEQLDLADARFFETV